MSGLQTKTALNPRQLAVLARGVEHFNRERFFEAHEEWEIGWRKLPRPDRNQVQAAILVCGVFVLLRKGRIDPAGRLARLATVRFAEAVADAEIHALDPALSLPDSENRMLRILARMRLGESNPSLLLSEADGLRAVVNGLT